MSNKNPVVKIYGDSLEYLIASIMNESLPIDEADLETTYTLEIRIPDDHKQLVSPVPLKPKDSIKKQDKSVRV